MATTWNTSGQVGNNYYEAPVLQADSFSSLAQTSNRAGDSSTLFYPENVSLGGGQWPAVAPDVVTAPPVQVQVTPEWNSATGSYSPTTFDITFTGISADQDLSFTDPNGNVHSALLVSQAKDGNGNVQAVSEANTQILKKPSAQFMVNDADQIDSVTGQQELYNKLTPAVAMDNNGEFVVTWEQYTSLTDGIGNQIPEIFAKRFLPDHLQPVRYDPRRERPGHAIRGECVVRRQSQAKPGHRHGSAGGFRDRLEHHRPDPRMGNNVDAQRFDFQGNKVLQEFQADPETAQTLGNVKVGMSPDGHFGIVYSVTNDNVTYGVDAQIYNAQGVQVYPAPGTPTSGTGPQLAVGGGGLPSIAFDANNDFAVGWSVLLASGGSTDGVAAGINNDGGTSAEMLAQEYNISGTVVVPAFRVNSSDFPNPAANKMWSGPDGLGQVTFDANGDLTVAYQGAGPAVMEEQSIQTGGGTSIGGMSYVNTLVDQYFNEPANADLKTALGGSPTRSVPAAIRMTISSVGWPRCTNTMLAVLRSMG